MLRRPPAARAAHRRGPLPGVRRPPARAVRQLVRVLPALRGRRPRTRRPARSPAAPSRPPPSASTPSPRWASTSSTCRRSTRSARSTARARTTPSTPAPTTPARRGRSAPRTAATTRSTPTSARSRTSTRSSPGPGRSASRSRSTSRCRPRPTTRGSTTHPEWFTTRADGTIAYAENPPKKYQDIYPINFDNDPTGICREVLRVVRLWMSHGVRIFRVDNPHTKPVAFWEWLLKEIRRTDPDVLFLSEAFTRPAMMHGLGAVGFHQSYTYFTWRTAKWEIEEYLREVSHETDHLMRPNFFVNTPDILHAYLQYGGPAAFKIRAVLAATGSPELGRVRRLRAVRARRGEARQRGVPRLGEVPDPDPRLGRRRGARAARSRRTSPGSTRSAAQHPALQLLRNVRVHCSDDENVLVFSKSTRPARRRHRHRRRQPRPARRPRDRRSTSTCPRSAWTEHGLVRRPRRDHRRGLELGRAQLRPARPVPRARPHPDRQEASVTHEASPSTEVTQRDHARLVQDRGLLRGPGPRRSATPTATAPATSAA